MSRIRKLHENTSVVSDIHWRCAQKYLTSDKPQMTTGVGPVSINVILLLTVWVKILLHNFLRALDIVPLTSIFHFFIKFSFNFKYFKDLSSKTKNHKTVQSILSELILQDFYTSMERVEENGLVSKYSKANIIHLNSKF